MTKKRLARPCAAAPAPRILPVAYKPTPFALDQPPPDVTIQMAMWFLQLSARAVRRRPLRRPRKGLRPARVTHAQAAGAGMSSVSR